MQLRDFFPWSERRSEVNDLRDANADLRQIVSEKTVALELAKHGNRIGATRRIELESALADANERAKVAEDTLDVMRDRLERIAATATAKMAHNHKRCVEIALGREASE